MTVVSRLIARQAMTRGRGVVIWVLETQMPWKLRTQLTSKSQAPSLRIDSPLQQKKATLYTCFVTHPTAIDYWSIADSSHLILWVLIYEPILRKKSEHYNFIF